MTETTKQRAQKSWEIRVLGHAARTEDSRGRTAGEDTWDRRTVAGHPWQERDDRTDRT